MPVDIDEDMLDASPTRKFGEILARRALFIFQDDGGWDAAAPPPCVVGRVGEFGLVDEAESRRPLNEMGGIECISSEYIGACCPPPGPTVNERRAMVCDIATCCRGSSPALPGVIPRSALGGYCSSICGEPPGAVGSG